jgi:hypothetical protein
LIVSLPPKHTHAPKENTRKFVFYIFLPLWLFYTPSFHHQGLGVVCNKEGGFGDDDFVVEFLGEV